MERELDDCRVERRLSESTCRASRREVGACRRSLGAAGIADLRDVGPAELRRIMATEAVHRPAASSQARTVAALKGFFGFCVENEALDRDPALMLRTVQEARAAARDVLDRRGIVRLLGRPDRSSVWQRDFAHKREPDRLPWGALFAYAELRRGEMLGPDWMTSTSSAACCACGRPFYGECGASYRSHVTGSPRPLRGSRRPPRRRVLSRERRTDAVASSETQCSRSGARHSNARLDACPFISVRAGDHIRRDRRDA